ncbi:MAG: TolC family protein [Terriglobales bacterium]
MSIWRRVALFAVAVLAFSTSVRAQDYSRGKSAFPNVFAPYTSQQVPPPKYTNSARINNVLKDGKLQLSLDDAIVLALENNLDLAISRYNLSIADTEILRTKGGAASLGVNTGIVQGTPGGGTVLTTGAQGGGPGGTTTAAGGAGTGAGGIVTSTLGAGPSIPSFDPVLSSSLFIEHGTFPQSSSFVTGTSLLQQNTGTANFSYTQGFATGTSLSVTYNNNRQTTNNLRSMLNPILNGSYRIQLTQPLLEGFGIGVNRRFIRIAKNNREITDVAFRLQVTTTVGQIENIYWNLVNAYEDVKAKQRAVDLANRLLADNEKQVRIGTLAPIEVVRAQAQVASATQDLIVSQTNLQLQQLFMKNAISRNLTDTRLAAAEVIPTDTMQMPAVEPVVPTQDLINEALAHRPELAQARIDLTNREINKKAAQNSLLPSVNLVGWYGTSALAGVQNPLAPPDVLPPGSIPTTGYSDIFHTLFGNDFPDYAVGINVSIPIRNRVAQATQARAELEYRQAQMRLQQLENQIRIEVRNAQFALQQNRARVDAAVKGRELARQSLDAEQKKYALGASTTYNVLQMQRDLATAESSLITAMAAYEQSRVELDRATGLTLTHLGIELAEAETGNITKMPHVPGVAPAGSVQPSPAPSTQAPPSYGTPAPTPAPEGPAVPQNAEPAPQQK